MKKRSLFICVVIKNPCGLRIIHSNTVLDWMTIISLFKIYNSKLWLLEMISSVIIAETMKVQKRVLFTPVMDRVWTVWDRSVSCSWWWADYSPLGARSWSVMVLPFEVTVCNCNVIPSELSALYVSLVKTVLLIVPCLFKKAQTQTCSFQPDTWRSNPNQHHQKIKQSCLFLFFFFFLLLCQSIFCVECCDITCGRDQLNVNLFLRMWWTAENIQEQQMPAECEQCKEKHRGHRGTCGPDNLVMVVMMMKRTMMMKQKWSVTPPSLPPDRPRPCHMYDHKWRFPLHVYQE